MESLCKICQVSRPSLARSVLRRALRCMNLPNRSMSRKGDMTAPEPFIPRRGEKDFEPSKDTATYQEVQLQESRNALFAALSAGTRHHSSKIHNAAVWHPSLSRASMDPLRTKGIHFTIMGRHEPTRKRLELLPEETLYLVERGTLECYTERQENLGFAEGVEGGVPFSVQHAFSEMLGREGLTAERYQVHAYLCKPSENPLMLRSIGVRLPAKTWICCFSSRFTYGWRRLFEAAFEGANFAPYPTSSVEACQKPSFCII